MHRLRLPILLLVLGAALTGSAEERVVQLMGPEGDGQGHPLHGPRALGMDGKGNLYVAGLASNNVFRIAPDGSIVQLIERSGDGQGHELVTPRSLAADAVGNVYVAGEKSAQVFRIAPDGTITHLLGPEGDGQEGHSHRLIRPTNLAVGPGGTLYVAGQNSNNVFRLARGKPAEVIIDVDAAGKADKLRRPNGLGVDAAGNVYVAGAASDNVFRITPSGEITATYDMRRGPDRLPLDFPNNLFLDAAGNVYVSGNNSTNVLRLLPDGTAESVFQPMGDGRFGGAPMSLAVSPDGVVFTGHTGSGGVWRHGRDGKSQPVLLPEDVGAGPRALRTVRGLLLAPDGHLYVAATAENRLLRIAPGPRPEPPAEEPRAAKPDAGTPEDPGHTAGGEAHHSPEGEKAGQ